MESIVTIYREFSYSMPSFKKVIEVRFPRMFAPEWIGRAARLPRVSKIRDRFRGEGKVAPSREIRQKQYHGSNKFLIQIVSNCYDRITPPPLPPLLVATSTPHRLNRIPSFRY